MWKAKNYSDYTTVQLETPSGSLVIWRDKTSGELYLISIDQEMGCCDIPISPSEARELAAMLVGAANEAEKKDDKTQ